MGPSIAQQVVFSVPISSEILYNSVGTITVSPPGSAVSNSNGVYTAYWPSGTQLTVTLWSLTEVVRRYSCE
ncbi:MAG: hypothetical protein KGI38_12200 [Thaumarchaeota archaeon]|nr:hypothetical protein [Nitrososphaerota archaeon]